MKKSLGSWKHCGPVWALVSKINSLGEYCDPNTDSSVFLILISTLHDEFDAAVGPELMFE